MVRRVERQGEVLISTKNGSKIDELLQAGENWHKRRWKDVETNASPSRG